jgi:hypothetical protein
MDESLWEKLEETMIGAVKTDSELNKEFVGDLLEEGHT